MAPVSTSSSASHRRGDRPFHSGPQAGELGGGILSQVVQVQAGPQQRAPPLKFDTLVPLGPRARPGPTPGLTWGPG